ncbi:inosine-5-monophosphate dehydrogenase [archaeon]|nr:inosine-5-monophosphate dehydrogenase [archaeon]
MDKVSKIMSKKVKTVSKDDIAVTAAKTMLNKNVSCVVVVDRGIVEGIVTERDLAVKILSHKNRASDVKVEDIMTSPVFTLSPDKDVYYCSEIMRKNGIKKLPIVRGKRLVGIVTQTDILDYFRDQRKKFVLKHLSREHRKSYPVV